MYEDGQNMNPSGDFDNQQQQNPNEQSQRQKNENQEPWQFQGEQQTQSSNTYYTNNSNGNASQPGPGDFGPQTGFGGSSPQPGPGGPWGPVPPFNGNWNQPPQPPKQHSGAKRFWGFIGKVAAGALAASIIFTCVFGAATHIGLVKVTNVTKQTVERGSDNSGSDDFVPYSGNGPSFGGRGGDDGSEDNGSGNADGDNGKDTVPDGTTQQESDGPKLGVSVQDVSEKQVSSGYPEGIMIMSVEKGSAAEEAGLEEGDVITAFNGSTVSSTSELASLIADCSYGKDYKLNYKRQTDGSWKAMSATITFTDSEESTSSAS